MEEAGIIGYIGNLVIGFTPERYIGNPVMFLVSCILVLRPWPTIFWFYTATISWIYVGHHILDLRPSATTSCLILFSYLILFFFMTYSTCSTDAGATSVNSLHDLPSGSSHTQSSHTCHRISNQIHKCTI